MELIETPVFTRQVEATLTPEEYREFQLHLMMHPALGKRIRGAGGLRKIRWRVGDRGKRGGIRVIYHWKVAAAQLFLLYLFPKNARSDLTAKELRILRALITDD